jgi:hypothetical protein
MDNAPVTLSEEAKIAAPDKEPLLANSAIPRILKLADMSISVCTETAAPTCKTPRTLKAPPSFPSLAMLRVLPSLVKLVTDTELANDTELWTDVT